MTEFTELNNERGTERQKDREQHDKKGSQTENGGGQNRCSEGQSDKRIDVQNENLRNDGQDRMTRRKDCLKMRGYR